MRFEMICTGEEVLSGQIIDTNAAWVAQTLMSQGIEMQRRMTVGDRLEDLVEAFRSCAGRADVVLVNGGLGPTADDLSAEAMATLLEVPLELNAEWLETMTRLFERRGRTMSDKNRKQALLPKGAIMVDNPVGTACGFRACYQGTWYFFTPGVPSELKRMVHEQLLPWLKASFPIEVPVGLHRMLTIGQGESNLAQLLEPIPLPPGVTLGFRASLPYIEIKLLQRRPVDPADWQPLLSAYREALGDALIGENIKTLPEAVHQALLAEGKTLATAESCTGGMVASQLVDLAGSSAYLVAGLVTYSNDAKKALLGVSEATLQQHGAVSLETVLEMAQGARTRMGTDLAVSISGIAGPDGGTEAKPVGTVSFALTTEQGSVAQTLHLGARDRNAIRLLAATVALDMVRRALLGLPVVAEYGYLNRVEQCQITA
ncbi:CinA family nicotinamide mononucleotide deamidase-related protein [Ferrimonas balearica]|uniref:CinA family nicotinamide mononucleotide deamidase-related protein n=1 Tax=Ferrimonas balearica TaxID=44012 RepID=UPI001C94BDF4|nr:CinA family nicotinamide mononucleotide deamidase-related protein [Ferrimonas balearica]MBY6107851.1 CinA family nicotinamide mononucleotide deamidase-related protein [Ferrimonas balearica]